MKRLKGKTSGLGVRQIMRILFEQNEKCKVSHRASDDDIRAYLFEEFGDARDYLKDVARFRAMYNEGALTGGHAPKRRSRRYDQKGRLTKKGQWPDKPPVDR